MFHLKSSEPEKGVSENRDQSVENSEVEESFESSTVEKSFENSTVEENFESSFEETASSSNAEESFQNSMIEQTAGSSNVDESIHVSYDLTEIFSYYVTNPCRKLAVIVDTLYSLGMPKMGVHYARLKVASVSDIIMFIRCQNFFVMACANTRLKATIYAARLMLILMGFAKSKCLQNSQVKQKASTSSADDDSAPMTCDEDFFRLFADIDDPVARLNKVVHSLYIAERNLNVKFETYETSTNIKFVKCTVCNLSTIAAGNNVERATRTASFFMLNRLGLQRNACFLPAEMQRDLKMISDENMRHMIKARRRLFPA